MSAERRKDEVTNEKVTVTDKRGRDITAKHPTLPLQKALAEAFRKSTANIFDLTGGKGVFSPIQHTSEPDEVAELTAAPTMVKPIEITATKNLGTTDPKTLEIIQRQAELIEITSRLTEH